MKTYLIPALLLVTSILAAACASPPPAEPTLTPLIAPDSAETALLQFFQRLAAGDYQQAALLYGGSFAPLQQINPGLDDGNQPALLRNACEVNGYQCLPVLEVLKQEQVADNQFLISVSFLAEDGSTFVRGPCCGASDEQQPRQSIFQFRVTRTEAVEYLVMDLPVYVP